MQNNRIVQQLLLKGSTDLMVSEIISLSQNARLLSRSLTNFYFCFLLHVVSMNLYLYLKFNLASRRGYKFSRATDKGSNEITTLCSWSVPDEMIHSFSKIGGDITLQSLTYIRNAMLHSLQVNALGGEQATKSRVRTKKT